MTVPVFTLANGVKIPAIAAGFGTRWSIRQPGEIDPATVAGVKDAISVGISHIDGAQVYGTEREIGEAISGVKRDSIFITTKVMREVSDPLKALEDSLAKFKIEYVDLYLIHSPFSGNLPEIWKGLEAAYKQGKAKAIGVSNFKIEHLKEILAGAEIKPVVNQIEYHPYLQNQSAGIVKFSQDNDILVEAYGPLTPITKASDGPLTPVLEKLSKKYNKNPAQILLRWTYETGVLPVTASNKKERLKDSLEIFTFELDKADREEISTIGASHKFRAFFTDKTYFD